MEVTGNGSDFWYQNLVQAGSHCTVLAVKWCRNKQNMATL